MAVLLPAGGRYPRDAHTVLSVHEDFAQISRSGGGLIFTVKAEELSQWRLVAAEDKKVVFEAITVTIEGEGRYEAVTDGSLWNGWVMPLFTREVAEQVCRGQNDTEWRYDAVTDVFLTRFEYEGDWDEWAAVEVEGVKRYPIGAGCWIWSDASAYNE